MKNAILVASWIVTFAVVLMFAQSYAGLSLGPIAPTVSQCPTASATGATLCPVGTSTTGYGMYVSYNGAAYQLLTPAGSVTGSAPIVVSGTAISCPTCVTGSVVNSFNTRTGAVTLSDADVTGTGLKVVTTVTSTATSTPQ
jgi:hypothetical protein